MRTHHTFSTTSLLLTTILLLGMGVFHPLKAEAKSVLVPQDDNAATGDSSDWKSKFQNLGLGKLFGNKETPKPTDESAASTVLPQTSGGSSEKNMSSGVKPLPMMPKAGTLEETMALYKQAQRDEYKRIHNKPPRFSPEININYPEEITKDYQGRLMVDVPAQYMWGTNDVDKIRRVFGYQGKDIQENCQLRLSLMLKASKSSMAKYIMAGHSDVVKFDGDPYSLTIISKAVCRKPAQGFPQNSQSIGVLGDLYTATLSYGLGCPIDASAQGKTLTINHKGDGVLDCNYQ